MDDTFLTDVEAAKLTSTHPQTWRKWRVLGKGPRYVKIGGSVRYRLSDIQAWLEANTVSSTAQG